MEKGFAAALRSAVNSDPLVLEAQQEAITLGAKLDTTIGLKDFQVSGDVYGGVEDVTDEIAGIALALNADRLICKNQSLQSLNYRKFLYWIPLTRT